MSALEGIKVLDLTSMVSGPVAAMMPAQHYQPHPQQYAAMPPPPAPQQQMQAP